MTLPLTINETLKWLSLLPILKCRSSSGGDSVYSVRYSLLLTPTSSDLGPLQYLFRDDSALNQFNQPTVHFFPPVINSSLTAVFTVVSFEVCIYPSISVSKLSSFLFFSGACVPPSPFPSICFWTCEIVVSVTVNHSGLPPCLWKRVLHEYPSLLPFYTPPLSTHHTKTTSLMSTHYTKTTSLMLTHNTHQSHTSWWLHNTHQSDRSWWLHNTHQSHTSSTGTHNTNEVQSRASVSHMHTQIIPLRANRMKIWLLS